MPFTHSDPLITWTTSGLYCPAGGFFIDPHRAVDRAIITHAHSDHARKGSKLYYCVDRSVELLKNRLGPKIDVRGIPYGETFCLGDVKVSLHSAGHILGSAQVRVERAGRVWVASGDYKRDPDPSCDPFEVVPCDVFITEATFGTPQYVWPKGQEHGRDIFLWWQHCAELKKNAVLFGYSLGKAQRILAELAPLTQKPILIYPTIVGLADCYRREGVRLAPTQSLAEVDAASPQTGQLILAPPMILRDQKFTALLGDYQTAFASGWMQKGGYGYGGSYDRGFVMSDHADWTDLNQTIIETGARRVFVQHRNGALIKHLRIKGIDAHPVTALAPLPLFREAGL